MELPIVGSYQLINKLGEGAFGQVFEAEHVILGRKTALKRLKPLGSPEEQVRRFEMFLREARILASLNDDHIVQIYDIFRNDEGVWIAMEFIDGTDAENFFRKKDIALSDLTQIFYEMVEGVEVLHSQGIVHRDLKPANFMVNLNTMQVKTTDFGIAFGWNDTKVMTKFQSMTGTLIYMAPEMLEPGPVDYRADLWALGVILYYMMSKTIPFAGDTELQVIKAIGAGKYKPLQSEDYPKWVSDITEGLLKQKPEERIQSCREILKRIPLTHGMQYKNTADLNREELLNALLKILPEKDVLVDREEAMKIASKTLGIDRLGKNIRFEFLSAIRRGVKRKLIRNVDNELISRL